MEEVVKDLRSANKNGRPSNEERSTTKAINADARILVADLMKELRRDIKVMTPAEKTNLLGKLLTHIADDEQQSPEDVSFDILAEKALKIEMRVGVSSKKTSTKKSGKGAKSGSSDKGNA